MSLIVKRATKGSGLTSGEIDANVNNLNNDKVEINNSNFKAAPSLVNNLIPLTGTVLPAINPSLNLDFANGKQLDPRITFSRNTVATYCDGKTTKLAEQNLLTYSQDFRTATQWATSAQSAGIAPDGTNTLNLIIEDTSLNTHHSIGKSITGISGAYTASFFLQSNTRTYACVEISTDSYSKRYSVLINLSTGAFVSSQSIGLPVGTSYSIQAYGSAYRVSVTATNTSGVVYCRIALSDSSTPAFYNNAPVYTGDGTSSIYAWGAQLEQRSFASTYTPTTSTPITNYVSAIIAAPAGVPRFDYDPVTKKCLGLLIEELRTNSLVNSTIDGANLTTQSITTTAVARTLSFYGTGTIVLSGTKVATIVGLGAYPTRTTYTYTPTAGTLTLTVSGTVQYANDEVGAFATSYIPTAGTALSRAADSASITGTNFSSWYNQSQGSFFVVYNGGRESPAGGYGRVVGIMNSSANFLESNGSANSVSSWNGSKTTALNSVGDMWDTGGKAGMSYSITSTILSVNGVSITNTDLPTWSTLISNSIGIGGPSYYLNGHIRKLSYYPKALTAVELQGLTS